MQSRRSLLVWKIFGRRLDGWQNDDFPHETIPGDPGSLHHKGQPVPDTPQNREHAHVGYVGSSMPPADAVRSGKVKPLSDEDRLTLVRWIDLGCPIDLTYDPQRPDESGRGWMLDDQRPTLTLTEPRAGVQRSLNRILIGMHDYGSGLARESFQVTTNFTVNGLQAGTNLAPHLKSTVPGVWQLDLKTPIDSLPQGSISVSVQDRQGNTTRIDRTFFVRNPNQ
jgi:hypothetical protein